MKGLKVLSVAAVLCIFVSQSAGLHGGGGWRGGDSSDGGNRYSSGGHRRGWGSLKAQLHQGLNSNGWNVVGGPGGGAGLPSLIVGIAPGGGGGGGGYGGGSGGGGNSGGWGSGGGGKPPRGSQVYLQDPWNHEHNYFDDSKHGHSKHGWGGGHQISRLPDHATYVQKLVPVLNLGKGLKRLTSALEGVHPNLKWQKPSLAFFGLDGSAHNVKLSGGHGGQYENDGWGYNHGSHHIGHQVNSKPHYSTW